MYNISLFKEKEGTDEDSMIKNVLNVSIKLINHLCFIGKLYQIIQLIEKNPNSHNKLKPIYYLHIIIEI